MIVSVQAHASDSQASNSSPNVSVAGHEELGLRGSAIRERKISRPKEPAFVISLSVCLSTCLPVCLSVGQSVCQPVCQSVGLSSVGLLDCRSVGQSVCLSVGQLVCVSLSIVHQSFCLYCIKPHSYIHQL